MIINILLLVTLLVGVGQANVDAKEPPRYGGPLVSEATEAPTTAAPVDAKRHPPPRVVS
jgi:hypothetical protein